MCWGAGQAGTSGAAAAAWVQQAAQNGAATAAAMKVPVATIERGDSLASPQIPWPLVQPDPSVAPKPTSRPAAAVAMTPSL